MSRIDLAFLERALALAERGRYTVAPNPMVGAVVVRGGRIVAEGASESLAADPRVKRAYLG